jgi:hypothetical protein
VNSTNFSLFLCGKKIAKFIISQNCGGRTMNPSCDEYLKKKEEAISFQFVGADLFCPPLVLCFHTYGAVLSCGE